MTITFYKNHSDNFEVPKNLTDAIPKDGTLRDETEVMQPSILMEFDPRGYNYCYIDAFSRYYYITGIESVRKGLWRVSCNRDPLQSFWDKIKESPIIVNRASYQFNNYLIDKQREFEQPFTQVKELYDFGNTYKTLVVTIG